MNGVLADLILGSFLAYSFIVVYTVVLVYITYHLLNLLFGSKKQSLNIGGGGVEIKNELKECVVDKDKVKKMDKYMWIFTIIGTVVTSIILYIFLEL